MPEWFVRIIEASIVVIHAMAAVFVVVGAVVSFVRAGLALLSRSSHSQLREVWLSFARALVAALTFQLAADILESAIDTSWERIGQLAAIAVIRTFLNYFLERDLREMREVQRERAGREA